MPCAVRPGLAVCAALILAFVLETSLAAQGPRRSETEVAHVPDDAFLAMLFRPRLMLAKYGNKTRSPVELMRKSTSEGAGFEIDNLDEFLFVIGYDPDDVPAEDDDPDFPAAPDLPRSRPDRWFSMVMRFREPPDEAKIVEKMFAGAERAEHDGQKYYKSSSSWQPSGWFADERTLVAAMEPRLKRIMKQDGMGSLRHHLRRTDPRADAALVLSMDTGKAWFEAVLPGEELPLAMRPVIELPKHLDVAAITVDLSQDEPLKMLALAVDDRSARYLKGVADELHKTLKEVFAAGREEIAKSSPNPRMAELSLEVIGKFLDGIELEQEDRKIRGTVKAQGGLKAAAELLVETFADSHRTSRRWQRQSDLMQVGAAMNAYHEKHKRFPPAASYDKEGRPLLSWRVHLLPYMDGGDELYRQFRLDEPWDSRHNKTLLDKMPPVYAFDQQAGGSQTQYLAVVGDDTVMRAKRSVAADDIKDNREATIVLVEVAAGHAVPWTKPVDFSAAGDMDKLTVADDESHFLVLTAEGTPEQIKKSKITPAALKGFFTIAGGEEQGIFEFSY